MMPDRRLLPPALVVVAVLCVLFGYADMARGGTTLCALLLAIGYCAAVPAALLFGGRPGVGKTDRR